MSGAADFDNGISTMLSIVVMSNTCGLIFIIWNHILCRFVGVTGVEIETEAYYLGTAPEEVSRVYRFDPNATSLLMASLFRNIDHLCGGEVNRIRSLCR
ncbi:hypothetical protein O9992_17700 [Vibrio lentus]|nr:hypothetical protein [Vibrio lentus]